MYIDDFDPSMVIDTTIVVSKYNWTTRQYETNTSTQIAISNTGHNSMYLELFDIDAGDYLVVLYWNDKDVNPALYSAIPKLPQHPPYPEYVSYHIKRKKSKSKQYCKHHVSNALDISAVLWLITGAVIFLTLIFIRWVASQNGYDWGTNFFSNFDLGLYVRPLR